MSDLTVIMKRLNEVEQRLADLEESDRLAHGGVSSRVARLIVGGPEELIRENKLRRQRERRQKEAGNA